MKFTKVQATGNDFVMIDARRMRRDWARLSLAMCDRRFGVGSDGLVLLLNSSKADFRMRMFNPDGSEAEVCGNGLRCFARYVVSAGLAGSRQPVTIETSAGIRTARPQAAGSRFQVDMGEPGLRPEDLPVNVSAKNWPVRDYPLEVGGRTIGLTFVSMGNPHAVAYVEDIQGYDLRGFGPQVEHHAIFPRRVNFEIVRVMSRKEVTARVWERGAGETLSCGTGACAIAVSSRLHDFVDSPVDIKLPGGTLSVEWDGKGRVFLSGPAEIVFEGVWPDRKPAEDK